LLGRSSIIRTVTVGSGVSPDLLTLDFQLLFNLSARGLFNAIPKKHFIKLPPVGNFAPPRSSINVKSNGLTLNPSSFLGNILSREKANLYCILAKICYTLPSSH